MRGAASSGEAGAKVGRPSAASTQVSFDPPPWLELTTSAPSGSATRVRPPGSSQTSLAVVDRERPQVDVPRRQRLVDQHGRGGQRHRPLRDPAARLGRHAGVQLGEGRARPPAGR